MRSQNLLTGDWFRYEITVYEVAKANGFRASAWGPNGTIFKHQESGQELDQFELMRLYSAKE
ncbi:hypothetical protein [Desulfovibrio falkowii]|uniref:hypothetical protein n=1 Tax=Desulfovibrio sp. WGS1351 TaxID=3366814 RepID=UPI00372D1D6B